QQAHDLGLELDVLPERVLTCWRLSDQPHSLNQRGGRSPLAEMQAGTLPCQAVWKFSRDSRAIIDAQQLLAASHVKVAYGTDCGMFPFSHGIFEFQAMVAAGLSPLRALRAATSVAAELLGRDDIGVLEPGASADIVAMAGNPLEDIAATAGVDFVMRSGLVHRHPAQEAPHG
ncbi:amidohydrolase family protein, partial [Acidiferrimicrobium sp. IK]|uniref:amidohydrolase family protein n=1 Tax=Acidiferrimicrobium sp. IK TaxID=2871700 RepID=UPI0021CB9430